MYEQNKMSGMSEHSLFVKKSSLTTLAFMYKA